MMTRVGKSWAWTLIQAFLTAVLFALLYWAWILVASPANFPVRQINIIAPAAEVSHEKIRSLVLQNFQGGFFSFKSSPIKNALLNEPWISSVSLRRIWPDTIELKIAEKTAILQWNSSELVDNEGKLFEPAISSFPKNLPQLSGPENNFKEAYEKYELYTAALKSLGLSIQTLKESDRLSWTMQLHNKIVVILGEKNPDERLHRFAEHYQKLIGTKSACVDYVDLRYPDGMTIHWKNLDKNNQCVTTAAG